MLRCQLWPQFFTCQIFSFGNKIEFIYIKKNVCEISNVILLASATKNYYSTLLLDWIPFIGFFFQILNLFLALLLASFSADSLSSDESEEETELNSIQLSKLRFSRWVNFLKVKSRLVAQSCRYFVHSYVSRNRMKNIKIFMLFYLNFVLTTGKSWLIQRGWHTATT